VLRVAWRSLRAHKSRLVLSTFAVVLSVAFVAGSFVFGDTLKATFNELFGETAADAVVQPVSDVDTGFEDAAVTLPASMVATVESAEGVERALGGVFVEGVTIVGSDGKALGSGGAPTFGVDWSDDPDLSPLAIQEGRGPETAGEVAIDSQAADKGDLQLGDTVVVIPPTGARLESTLTGIFKFGESGNLAGASLVAFTPEQSQALLTAPGRITQIDVKAEPGFTQEQVVSNIQSVLAGDDVTVKTGQQVADENASDISNALSFFNYIILAFGAISVLVGVFLIINTFSMLVASRTRELALLRALGASRRQVTQSLLVEAVVVGFVGATLGVLLGLLIAVGLTGLLSQFGLDLPESSLVVLPRTIVVGYVIGIGVTLVSAWFPSRRASKLPPVAAMSETVTLPTRSVRRRTIAGGVITGLGVLALLAGVGSDSAGDGASLVGLGALLTLVGVAVVAPVLVGPIVGAIGWPVRRLSKLTGRLAVDNAGRNRVRTAGTAAALMIGLAVVSTFAILGGSVKASVDQAVDDTLTTDFIIQPVSFTLGFSPDITRQVGEASGVAAVTSVETVPVEFDRSPIAAVTTDTVEQAVVTDTGGVAWTALDDGGVAVDVDTAASNDLAAGDLMTLNFPTEVRQLPVAFVYSSELFSGPVIAKSTARAAGIKETDAFIFVKADDGAVDEVRGGLEAIVEQNPVVKVEDLEEFKEAQRSQVDQLLAFIYVMLALSILIAILGIVNTLALSVIERTREIGLLRAVGMSRTQIRRMIRWEAVIIAVMGAVLGIVLGVVFGAALQAVLSDEGITKLSIPGGQFVLFVVVAGVVGVLAAVRPARRAARLDVLKAISTQ
jgi:putative ABC transport system permease protein